MNDIIEWLKFIYNHPLLPDWIESLSTFLAALFALIGLRFAWKSLRKDISDQQIQITALTDFTKALGNQTDALIKSANINSQILDELRNRFFHDAKIAELQEEKDKINVRPDILIRLTNSSHNVIFSYVIENKGFNEARKLNIEQDITTPEDIETKFAQFSRDRLLIANDNIPFSITHKSNGIRPIPDNMGSITITFEDVYKNKYKSTYNIAKLNDVTIIVRRVSQEETK